MGSLGWSKANRERKCVGEDGAVPPTGNPGLRHWLDCVAVGIALLDPVVSTARQLRRAAAARSALLLAEEPSENKHKGCNWQHSDGKECECRADRKPSVLQMPCMGQGLLATACCCTEPCSPSIFHPWAQCALMSCCSPPRLCHDWDRG